MSQNIDGENIPAARVRKPAKLTRRRFVFLGALAGCMSAFFTSAVFLAAIGLALSPPYLLFEMALSAVSGIIVTIVGGEHEGSRWITLAVAAFIGLLIPVCLIMALFLLAGTD
jgi:hypothetical protein